MLLKLDDGYVIENCFKYPFWMCITSQVGCPIGCGQLVWSYYETLNKE